MQTSRLHLCRNNLPGPTNRKGGQIISAQPEEEADLVTEEEIEDISTHDVIGKTNDLSISDHRIVPFDSVVFRFSLFNIYFC